MGAMDWCAWTDAMLLTAIIMECDIFQLQPVAI